MSMNGISEFFSHAYAAMSNVNTDLLIALDLGAFCALSVVVVVFCLISRRAKYTDKRPYFHLVNLFTAITLAVFMTSFTLAQSVIAAALLWCAGYLVYGLLCAMTKRETPVKQEGVVISSLPSRPQERVASLEAPAAKNSVRLEHALSIADKLLLKNLGKGDRQELEKMKTTLSVYKVKEFLTPQEGDFLNESFNALLKLMAKYNI